MPATLPTQGVSEMTWPTTEATSLTLKILQSSLRKTARDQNMFVRRQKRCQFQDRGYPTTLH